MVSSFDLNACTAMHAVSGTGPRQHISGSERLEIAKNTCEVSGGFNVV